MIASDSRGSLSAAAVHLVMLAQEDAKVRAAVVKYENTGVRVEDDYVITDKGLQRISTAPREIDEIEALMKRRARVQP